MNPRISLLEIAHQRVAARLFPGAAAVDATVGNGYDTLFLLRNVMPAGRVYGFDVQAEALASARRRVGDQYDDQCLILFEDSHASMAEKVPPPLHGKIRAVMFNLGYLPGGDKSLITAAGSTLAALAAATRLVAADGIITIVAYPGHSGGAEETGQVLQWCAGLDNERFAGERIDAKNGDPKAPVLLIVTGKG